MIVARSSTADGADLILMVLEPGNIAKLQLGQPIVKKLKDFVPELKREIEIVIGYSPDVEFVAKQVKDGVPFSDALEKSFTRKENFSRHFDPDALEQVPLRDVEI